MIPIIVKAAKIYGDGVMNVSGLAKAIGAQRSSMYVWKRTPKHYCAAIVKATGGKVTLAQLRPDLFG